MPILKQIPLLLFLVFGHQVALGCGPNFPEELLMSRKDALMEPPPALFSKEVKKLIDKPRDDFAVVEADDSEEDNTNDLATIESQGLPANAGEQIAAMRREQTGDAAYQTGNGLPEDVRLYTAGAVDFHRAFPQPANKNDEESGPDAPEPSVKPALEILDHARQRFEAVAALPEQQASLRVVWATYMLGRIAAYQGNSRAAADYFQKTRLLVKAGFSDPLGLAVASLGEEARLYLHPGEYEKAVGFYLQQLSYGSKSAETSLKFVARKLLKQPELLDEALATPQTRALFFAHLYTKDVGTPFFSLDTYIDKTHGYDYSSWNDDESDDQAPQPDMVEIDTSGESLYVWKPESQNSPESSQNTEQDADETTTSENEDQDMEPPAPESSPVLWARIAESIERQGIQQVSGADWLAAAAYNHGQFDLAQRLVEHVKSPLSFWIKAKLAMRSGDQNATLAALAEAVRHFPETDKPNSSDYYEPYVAIDDPDNNWRESSLLYRLNAEQGILNLARGDFLQAMSYLYQGSARYWMDTAYVAERVLSLEELKEFVDQNVPEPTAEQRQAATETRTLTPGIRLRQLLARRLMRSQQFEAAITYFDDNELKALAKEYRDTLQQASSWWRSGISKAKAWYSAALLARFEGMELMGYEQAPDFSIWSGTFGPDTIGDYPGSPTQIKAELVSADEQRRVEGNRANPDIRFHYRLVAANHASQAADLLPPSSQAFASVLCHATSWNLTREPEFAIPFYKRYLREGAYVSWGKSFGRRCPEPDFDSAEKRLWHERLGFTITLGKLLALAGLVSLAILAWILFRLRLKRTG